ncbi:MAG: enoyl-[acyl-carrier-protein] reductase FabL [Leptolinea sp.]
MYNANEFEGKTALVTGSGRGIGRAIALRLAQGGADVVINYVRNQSPAEKVAEEIRAMGRKALTIRANVGKLDDIQKLFDQIENEFNGLDIFISNAASGFNKPAMQQKETGWDYTQDVNARSLLFCAQRAVPLMKKRGAGWMVAISSPGSSRVLPDYISVGASKAALEAITRYLAVELAQDGIHVNAVSPGLVLTDALQHFSVLGDPTVIKRLEENTPCGRLVTPEDVAETVAFLCTPAAEMICGQVIVVDGGYTLIAPR